MNFIALRQIIFFRPGFLGWGAAAVRALCSSFRLFTDSDHGKTPFKRRDYRIKGVNLQALIMQRFSIIAAISKEFLMDAIQASSESLDELYFPISEDTGNTLHLAGLYLSYLFWEATAQAIDALCTPVRPGHYNNCESRVMEIAKRILMVGACILTAPITMGLHLIGQGFHYLATQVMKSPYMYLQGTHPENVPNEQKRFFTLNTCMFPGGLPGPFGGPLPARGRMGDLEGLIPRADTICLQEMGFDAAMRLYEQTKDQYAHFYLNIGPNPPKMENCLFLATNEPICSEPIYVPFEVEGMQGGIKRGAFFIETPDYWICTAHLDPHDELVNQEVRRQELQAIVQQMQKFSKPCLLLGDLNVVRTDGKDDEYSRSGIPQNFVDPYIALHPTLTPESATCTDYLTDAYLGIDPPQPNWEIDDYALLFRNGQEVALQVEAVPTFDLNDPEHGVSDHRGLLLTCNVG